MPEKSESDQSAAPVGRPPHKPTRRTRITVERMRACGDAKDTIARALGIDRNTLDKHYEDELLNGASRRRQEVVNAVFAGVKAGNATLIKRAEEMTRASGALDSFDQAAADAAPKVVKQPKPGKKDIVHDAAMTAGHGTEWEDDLAPPPGTARN